MTTAYDPLRNVALKLNDRLFEAERQIDTLKAEIDRLKERERRAAELLRYVPKLIAVEWNEKRDQWLKDAGL
jgi:chromosome segregation ATPase